MRAVAVVELADNEVISVSVYNNILDANDHAFHISRFVTSEIEGVRTALVEKGHYCKDSWKVQIVPVERCEVQ